MGVVLHILPCWMEAEVLAGLGGLLTTAYVARAYVVAYLATRKKRR